MKNKFFTLLIASMIGASLQGQIGELGKFVSNVTEAPNDAKNLMEGFLSPYFNAFGASLTGGWYNTAKPHKLGGFDITATFNTAIVPTADRSLDITSLGLTNFIPADPANTTSPTIAGDKNVGPALNYDLPSPLPDQKAFDMPKGTGFPYIPTPMLQLGIGFVKETDIIGRFMPTYSFRGSQVGMWGLGFKHSLKQWIPVLEKVPVFHLSLQYGFTKLNASVGINVEPGDIGAQYSGAKTDWDNQKMEFTTMSHTGNLLISADLPVVTFYGGLGFATTSTDLSLKGDYPVIDPVASVPAGTATVTDDSILTDPFNLEIKNSDGSKTKPRINVGMRIKLGVLTFHGDYTYANYSMVSGGIGINFR